MKEKYWSFKILGTPKVEILDGSMREISGRLLSKDLAKTTGLGSPSW